MSYLEMAELFKVFAISLVLGAFIGLERERGQDRPLGIRSFSLVAGLGTLTALIARQTEMLWLLPAAFLVLGALLVVGYVASRERGRLGLTTELAGLATFGLGVLVFIGPIELAVALGVVTAALLHFKPQLHALADRAAEKDMLAMVQFGLVAFVVLPVLPNRNFGPYEVLNPYHIWLMVVLVSAINLAAYVLLKFAGGRRGSAVSGLLGGMVSSTATTYSFSTRARECEALSYSAAIAVIAASAVTAPRIAVIAGLVNVRVLPAIWLPLLVVFEASALPLVYYWTRIPNETIADRPEIKNPVQLGAALIFGLLYAVVSFAVAAAQAEYGTTGMYVVSAVSGLSGVDAITLSVARLVGAGRLAASQAADLLIVAYLANLLAKGALAALVGTPRLARIIAVAFGSAFVTGIIVILAT